MGAMPATGMPLYGDALVGTASDPAYWQWRVLPDGVIYQSYWAGVHEPPAGVVEQLVGHPERQRLAALRLDEVDRAVGDEEIEQAVVVVVQQRATRPHRLGEILVRTCSVGVSERDTGGGRDVLERDRLWRDGWA
jgi:hypothetical protein